MVHHRFSPGAAGLFSVLFLSGLLAACGGGSAGTAGTGDTVNASAPPAPSPALDFRAVKTFRFTWVDVSGATHYKLLENPDGISGFVQVGADIPAGTQSLDHVVPLYRRLDAQYILQSCNDNGCSDSDTLSVSGNLAAAIGYVKAGNNGARDGFGRAVALSADGNTLAVGVSGEDSNAIGINGNGADNSASSSGAVYVFSRSGSGWSQQAYIKASNTEPADYFGAAVSLSADGTTLAVGATGEDSNGSGQGNNSAMGSGAVYVFTRSANGTWTQQAYLKAGNAGEGDRFGAAVSLSADGNTLAVGADGEDSAATGINGNGADNSRLNSGAVYVFTRSGSRWNQHAYVKAGNTGAGDSFGTAVSLSADGATLAVGATAEDSDGSSPGNNSVTESGAVYVFARSASGAWSQQAYLKAEHTGTSDFLGAAVSLSADGNTLAVGAKYEDSAATGINGNGADNSAEDSGAVYVFSRSANGTWTRQAYLKAGNTGAGDRFGFAVSLSGDGNTLAVGAVWEDSIATGINGNDIDNSATSSGAVYVFSRNGNSWMQQAYVKAGNTGTDDRFGTAVSLSGDGDTLAVGANDEDGAATGVGGIENNNRTSNSGAVYLY